MAERDDTAPGDLKELEDSDPLVEPLAAPFEAPLPLAVLLTEAFPLGGKLFLIKSSETTTSNGFRLPCNLGLMRLSNSEISSFEKEVGREVMASIKL